jgi:hypothetical protein
VPRGDLAPLQRYRETLLIRLTLARRERGAPKDAFSTLTSPNSQKVREHRRPDAVALRPRKHETSPRQKMPPCAHQGKHDENRSRDGCPRLTIRGSWSMAEKRKKEGMQKKGDVRVGGTVSKQQGAAPGTGCGVRTVENASEGKREREHDTRGSPAHERTSLRTNRPTNLKPEPQTTTVDCFYWTSSLGQPSFSTFSWGTARTTTPAEAGRTDHSGCLP